MSKQVAFIRINDFNISNKSAERNRRKTVTNESADTFFPEASETCFPFRILGSMASISFITKLKSFSEKLNTSCDKKK